MRLIDAHKLKIQEFTGDPPPYAILSHRWGDDAEEVTYHEFHLPDVTSRPGYEKITNCCSRAVADGLHYVWVDTCCIDKRSSAELSEAINSMFNWYRDAVICYAYLDDVHTSEVPQSIQSGFGESAWFSRGWTLQELLAPSIVVFFTSDWKTIATRLELGSIISTVTNISSEFFVNGDLGRFSVAQKMSWASRRHTKRAEDEAYCLLGIFGVNMPLLYGEGTRAFTRLQEEISTSNPERCSPQTIDITDLLTLSIEVKVSDDHTLFAWTPVKPQNIQDYDFFYADSTKLDGGLLSPSVVHFAKSGHIVSTLVTSNMSPPYAMTNKGLQITLPVVNYQPEAAFINIAKSDEGANQQPILHHDRTLQSSSSTAARQSPTSVLRPIPEFRQTRELQDIRTPTTSIDYRRQRFYVLLNCCFENDHISCLAIVIESTHAADLRNDTDGGTFIRAFHAGGLIPINIAAVENHIQLRSLLIKPNDSILKGSRLWSSHRDGKLVLIEPLPGTVAGFELCETIPKISWKQQADTGGISLRLHRGAFSYGRVALMFSHKSGDYGFLLTIKLISHYDDGEDRYEVHYRTNLNRKEQRDWRHRFYDKFAVSGGGFFQEGPDEACIRLQLSVRQAHHALLLKLTDTFEGGKPFARKAEFGALHLYAPVSPKGLTERSLHSNDEP